MKRPAPSDAERPLRIRAPRHSRRELEKLLARAKRAIEAFATSDDMGAPPDKGESAPRRFLPARVS